MTNTFSASAGDEQSVLAGYFTVLRTRWVVAVAGPVLCIAAAVLITTTATPVYRAESRVFVNIPAAQGIQEALQGVQLSSQLMASYKALVESRTAADSIAEALDGAVPASEVDRSLSAVVETPALILAIRATATEPERSAAIADAGAAEVIAIIDDLESDRENPVEGRIVEQARVPGSPISPKPLSNLLVGILLGLASGLGGAFAWHALDRSVRSETEAEQLTGAPVLARVPVGARADPGPLVEDSGPAAEAFRTLRTSLRFSALDGRFRTLVVTSADEGDGKTTVAANLARTCAKARERVIMIDCDLRRPSLHTHFDRDPVPGLADVLRGDAALEDALVSIDPHLALLPAGRCQADTAELLGSRQMREMLDRLAPECDLIIADTPPLLALADAALLAGAADGVLLVSRWGDTERDRLASAAKQLRAVGARLLGTVVNRDKLHSNQSVYYERIERS